MKTSIICFAAFILLFVSISTNGAVPNADVIDPSFNPQIQTSQHTVKFVNDLITQPDGKILAAGLFNNYNGQSVGKLIRLNADGSLDQTFNNDLLTDALIEPYYGPDLVTLLPSGKLLVHAKLKLAGSTAYTRTIIRLNSNGSVDDSFNYAYSDTIFEIRVDEDGKVFVRTNIQVSENGQSVNKSFIRLNDDGTIDSSFNPQIPSSGIEMFTVHKDKIIYATREASLQQAVIYQMNSDGTPDSSFTRTPVGNSFVVELKAQPDDKILILSHYQVVRLNKNGGVDSSFQSTSFSPGQAKEMFLHEDGRITIAHSTGSAYRVIRLLANGTADPSFTPYNYTLDFLLPGFTVQLDGGILIGERNIISPTNGFMRLLPSGGVDPLFNSGESGFQHILSGVIKAISVLANEKILIGGDFDKVNNVNRSRIARLNADSTLDSTFQLNTNATGNYFSVIRDIYHFAVQSDGKIIVSGNFVYFINGVQKSNIVRLNSDGSIDSTFNLSVFIGDLFVAIRFGKNKPLQRPDGKILIGTGRPNGEAIKAPMLLSSTGSLDASFTPAAFNTKPNLAIYDLALQSDGKILIAGGYSIGNANGPDVVRGVIARLNSDGSVDQSFQAAEIVDKFIRNLSVLPNGQILIVSGSIVKSTISRLNSNGSVDDSFNTEIGPNGVINAIAILPNNKILVGGAFSTYNNQLRQNLAMLYPDGSLDVGIGNVNREILCITVDNQGRTLIGGHFTSISLSTQNFSSLADGNQQIARSYVARLLVSTEASKRSYLDFDGDGRSDISIYRDGMWWYAASSANNQHRAIQFGAPTDRLVPADYDGDGKTDAAVFRDGTWHMLKSSDNGYSGVQFGFPTDIPQPGDYDGDGKADVAVYRPLDGYWYIMGSRDGFRAVKWGASEDKPVAADFDGDGKTDIAVFRPSDGNWYLLRSRDGFAAQQFGASTDKPVVGDYDGDGKSDHGVFRPSNGTWYILGSRDGFKSQQFGMATDKPVPADYDGDGKTDYAVFRDGTWYQMNSSTGFKYVSFGYSTDKPIPNSFVQ